jgi:hypothetical protein
VKFAETGNFIKRYGQQTVNKAKKIIKILQKLLQNAKKYAIIIIG